ncbi:MAG: DUF4351 domain-containing protein [Castellaniella sp.]|uniref:DUF4351 domain-containing protein n=1 Tax=Castellaniella sp. TaxID=1955812 RepID=UPI003C709733
MLQHDLELPPQVYSLGPDKRTRLGPKFELVRALKRYGYDPVVFSQVYRMIEWVITLPKYLEPKFLQAVHALTEESKMTYVTLIEREAIKQTQANTLLRQIERRFGPVSATTTKRIQFAQAPKLETWLLNILDATTLKDVFASAPSSAPHPE